jgi:hypothetical protein
MPSGRKGCDDGLLLALAAGATPAAAAQQAHVSESTVRRRLRDPGFRHKVEERRSQMVSAAVGRLACMAVLAADTLHGLLASGSERVRLGAARSALALMLKGIEIHELAKQVAELKSRLGQLESSRLRIRG